LIYATAKGLLHSEKPFVFFTDAEIDSFFGKGNYTIELQTIPIGNKYKTPKCLIFCIFAAFWRMFEPV